MLQGPYGSLDRERDGPLIRLPFVSFAVGTVLLPFTGLIACLFISLVYHFEESTYTHCQVSGHMVQQTKESLSRVKPPISPKLTVQLPPDQHGERDLFLFAKVSNYLPSISAAISRVPERYIWHCCIGLHSAPRYLVTIAYFNFYRGRFARRLLELLLSLLALICSLAENTGLLLLTYVSSSETYSKFQALLEPH